LPEESSLICGLIYFLVSALFDLLCVAYQPTSDWNEQASRLRGIIMINPRILAVLAFGFLAACTGVVVQDAPAPRGNYAERDFDYATRKGAIVTIVSGNPFGGSQTEFAALVRRLMYEQNRELPADFVASHSDRTSPPYKVVVAFNKTPSISPDEMCARPDAIGTVPDKQTLRIDLAFCDGDISKSDTSGYASNVTGITHPNFSALVRQATFTMLPEPGETDRDQQSGNRFR
jgi:hypothetical protein